MIRLNPVPHAFEQFLLDDRAPISEYEKICFPEGVEKVTDVALKTIHDKSRTFRGIVRNGKPDGFGEMKDTTHCYRGFFKEGHFHGEGTLTSTQGFSVSGNWYQGKLNCPPVITYPNGDLYVGATTDHFVPKKIGYYFYKDACITVKSVSKDKFIEIQKNSGFDVFHEESGLDYFGKKSKGLYDGVGKLVGPNYTLWGFWYKGVPIGPESVKLEEGTLIESYYEKGVRSPYITINCPNGIMYRGEHKNFFPYGLGILFPVEGDPIPCFFQEDEMVKKYHDMMEFETPRFNPEDGMTYEEDCQRFLTTYRISQDFLEE